MPTTTQAMVRQPRSVDGGAAAKPGTAAQRQSQGWRRSMPDALGDVAQPGEHLLCKQGVGGSSPLVSTRFGRGFGLGFAPWQLQREEDSKRRGKRGLRRQRRRRARALGRSPAGADRRGLGGAVKGTRAYGGCLGALGR
jgi:hypothetical protein